jgi:hypothetical protein
MEPVTRSGDASFPPPPIFRSAKTPTTKSRAVTRLTSNLLPLELNQGTAKSVRIAKIPPLVGDPTMLPLNRLLEIASVLQSRVALCATAANSKDTPSVNAFCCVAPGVLLSAFAIFLTCFLTSKTLQSANIIFGPFASFPQLGYLNS